MSPFPHLSSVFLKNAIGNSTTEETMIVGRKKLPLQSLLTQDRYKQLVAVRGKRNIACEYASYSWTKGTTKCQTKRETNFHWEVAGTPHGATLQHEAQPPGAQALLESQHRGDSCRRNSTGRPCFEIQLNANKLFWMSATDNMSASGQ